MFTFKLLYTLARLCEGTPLQPLRLNFFGINFPSYPLSQLPFLTFHRQSGQQNKGKGAQIPQAWSTPQPAHPIDIAPHPISQLFTSMLHRCIPRLCAMQEELFPCVARNLLSNHSPCSAFAIASTGEGEEGDSREWEGGGGGVVPTGGHSRNDDDRIGSTTAAAPRFVGQRMEVSPEGDIVDSARPRGKGRVPHPGGLQYLEDDDVD